MIVKVPNTRAPLTDLVLLHKEKHRGSSNGDLQVKPMKRFVGASIRIYNNEKICFNIATFLLRE